MTKILREFLYPVIGLGAGIVIGIAFSAHEIPNGVVSVAQYRCAPNEGLKSIEVIRKEYKFYCRNGALFLDNLIKLDKDE